MCFVCVVVVVYPTTDGMACCNISEATFSSQFSDFLIDVGSRNFGNGKRRGLQSTPNPPCLAAVTSSVQMGGNAGGFFLFLSN